MGRKIGVARGFSKSTVIINLETSAVEISAKLSQS